MYKKKGTNAPSVCVEGQHMIKLKDQLCDKGQTLNGSFTNVASVARISDKTFVLPIRLGIMVNKKQRRIRLRIKKENKTIEKPTKTKPNQKPEINWIKTLKH